MPGSEKASPAPQAEGIRAGGTITVATTPPGGIEPASAYEPAGMAISSLVCETLVVADPKTGALRPGLAESWVVSDRGMSLQIKLRHHLTYQDGARFESRTVVDSLRRLANPDTASYAADLLKPVNGYDDYRSTVEKGTGAFSSLRGIRVIEPYSFEILFSQPSPDFVRTLANPATAPVQMSAALRNPTGFARQPICAGPYAVAAPYKPGDGEITLKRFAGYHGHASVFTSGGRGWAESIVFKVVPDAEAAYQAWQRGEVDVAPLSADRYAAATAASGGSVQSAPSPQVDFIGLPYGQESAFNDRAVRQAMAAALDRTRIANDVYGGSRAPATGFLPPAVGDAEFRSHACAFGTSGASGGAAVEKPAGLPTATVKLYFNDEFAHRRLAESVAAQWHEKLGLNVELQPLNWDQYLQHATTGSGFDGAFRVSWTPKVASGLSYLEPLFSSANIGNTNLERYSDVRLDDAIVREISVATDAGDRAVRIKKLEDKLCNDMPLIPIVFGRTNMLVRAGRLRPARADGRLFDPAGNLELRELAVTP